MLKHKQIGSGLVCAAATLTTLVLAHSRVSAQEMRMAMKSKQIATVDVRSEAAAKKLVDYLKSSRASYRLEMGSGTGRIQKLSRGSISMVDLRKIREKFKTPGQGGDGPIATNAHNGELADAGHVSIVVWGGFDPGRIAATLKGVDARLSAVKLYDKIGGKQIGTIHAATTKKL